MDGTGHGRPEGRRLLAPPPPEAALEVLSRRITPAAVELALQQTDRRGRRRRRLTPEGIVWLVIAMSLFSHGDVAAIWRQVCGTLAALREAQLGRTPPVKSAFSAARRRLGARPLRRLFVSTAGPVAARGAPGAFYKGLRLMALDAVSVDAPDTPANRAAFGASANRVRGKKVAGAYPRPTICLLEEVGTHVVCEALVRPFKCNELAAAERLLRSMPARSLVLWDRRYYSRHLLREALDRRVHFLGRISSQPRFTRLRELPDGSTLARIEPIRPGRRHPPQPITIRLIEYTLDDPRRPGHRQPHRLITSLLDHARYPARELVELYHQRWEIEISNDEFKTHQLGAARPTALRSLTPAGIVQEIYGLLLAYNGVRWLMREAAQEAGVDPRRLSFTHALRVVRETAPHLRAAPRAQVRPLMEAMLRHIGRGVLPPRANRINPRVVKRKMSHYRAKRTEHLRPPQPLKPFAEAIVLL